MTSNGSYVLGYQYASGDPLADTGDYKQDVKDMLAKNLMVQEDGTTPVDFTTGDPLPKATPIKLPSALAAEGSQSWIDFLQGADGTLGTPDDIALESFQINPDGTLVGSFSDGTKRAFGQVALTTFNNPPGLEKVGGSMYRQTNNSGVPDVGRPANGGRGTIESGTLEMSNVDLAQEFTNLIVAQRGFQANSKVVSTSDEVLSDLIQMKR